MPGNHALLSASSAGKWLRCPASARLEEQFPDSAGEAAAEGTLAHTIAELKLRKHYNPMKPSFYSREMKKWKSDPLYQEEMQRHTDTYIDHINSIAMACETTPFLAVEQRMDYSLFAPEGFGTADCILIYGNNLWIFDFKYGKGVAVSAAQNPQMMLYALGAVSLYGAFYPIQQITMTIIQPRLDNISSYQVSKDELVDWGTFEVRPKAKAAYDGGGECISGVWCDDYFCRARPLCRAYARRALEGVESCRKKPPDLMSETELGEALTQTQFFERWRAQAEDYALKAELQGRDIPGWKAVEGRSIRQFTDQDAAFEHLKNVGVDEAVLYERRPRTLAALEKDLGRVTFGNWMTGYIIKPPGKPTLVPDTDNRPPYNAAEAAFGTMKGEAK